MPLTASDVANDGAGFVIGSGDSADLGQVLFSVANPATAGLFTVSFTGGTDPVTSATNPLLNLNNLTDPSGDTINLDSFTEGTITIGSPVPEPPSFLLALSGMAVAMIAAFTRKRLGHAI